MTVFQEAGGKDNSAQSQLQADPSKGKDFITDDDSTPRVRRLHLIVVDLKSVGGLRPG